MIDKFINSLAEKVTVQVVAMLERRLPSIIETIVTTVIGEVFKRLQIPAPAAEVRNVVNDVLGRLGIRR